MPDTITPGTEGQTTEVQAPAQVTPNSTAQVAQATQGAGSGPWAAKLASTFADEATRSQVDAFLRTEIQPYTTRLEQQLAQVKPATELWQSLQEAPAEAYLSLTEELFGEQAVDAVIDILVGDEDDDTSAAETPAADTQTQRDPEVEELLAERREAKAREAYDAELNRVTEAHKDDVPVIPDLFHPFVSAAEGNFDAAYEGYKQYYAQFKAQFAPAEQQKTVDTPPNTLGSDTSTQAAPPTQPQNESIDDALDAIFNDLAAAPPVMGGV